MIHYGELLCPKCKGELKYYDSVKRLVRTKNRAASRIRIRRFRCRSCRRMHREIPDDIFPFYQYEAELIIGVLEGLITPETLGFEDYPCEATMAKWLSQKKQLLLWKAKTKIGFQLD